MYELRDKKLWTCITHFFHAYTITCRINFSLYHITDISNTAAS